MLLQAREESPVLMSNLILQLRREFMLARYHGRKIFERIRQRFASKRKIQASNKSVHIICVRKVEYLKAAIRCANSIWYHSPDLNIVLHLDSDLYKNKDILGKGLHRIDRVKYILEDSFETWQELKLKVILHDLSGEDYFSDADLYWNGPLPLPSSGIYFAAENALLNANPYASAISASGIEIENETFMANSSFICLGKDLVKDDFAKEVQEYFHKIRTACEQNLVDKSSERKILRLSEQISLSIAINKRKDYFNPLKAKDKPMDGGIAESYYLGTTKGWD
jgi:hypothetical protein